MHLLLPSSTEGYQRSKTWSTYSKASALFYKETLESRELESVKIRDCESREFESVKIRDCESRELESVKIRDCELVGGDGGESIGGDGVENVKIRKGRNG